MFAAGALGQGDTLADDDAELVRRRLIRMVDRWANDGLMVYTTGTGSFAMVAGTAGYATTGLSLGRPVTVQNVYVRWSNIDYPVEPIGEEDYNAIAYKLGTGTPAVYLNDTAYPTATFTFYPVPDKAYTCYVNGRYPLATALAFSDTVSLPPGYEAAIVDNLAVDICPSFGVQPTQQLLTSARASKDVLKVVNFVPQVMDIALGSNRTPGYVRIVGDT